VPARFPYQEIMTIKLAIDCMGGDHGVSVTVPAAISFLSSHDDAEMILVGLPDAIGAQLKKLHATDHPRVTVVPATEVITMDDPVEVALRKKILRCAWPPRRSRKARPMPASPPATPAR
jgi:glycerol-3-phosphate acyltransferase PlsX